MNGKRLAFVGGVMATILSGAVSVNGLVNCLTRDYSQKAQDAMVLQNDINVTRQEVYELNRLPHENVAKDPKLSKKLRGDEAKLEKITSKYDTMISSDPSLKAEVRQAESDTLKFIGGLLFTIGFGFGSFEMYKGWKEEIDLFDSNRPFLT